MRSRAAIGNHPLHPALVALPVGAFFLAFIADVAFLRSQNIAWAQGAGIAIGVGILTALLAAVTGFIDYTGLPAGSTVKQVATIHMALNLALVALYAISLYLRYTAPTRFEPDVAALAVAWTAFGMLLASGWLGGKMVFELRAGVVEEPRADEVRVRP